VPCIRLGARALCSLRCAFSFEEEGIVNPAKGSKGQFLQETCLGASIFDNPG
jgi:hypothetical protein